MIGILIFAALVSATGLLIAAHAMSRPRLWRFTESGDAQLYCGDCEIPIDQGDVALAVLDPAEPRALTWTCRMHAKQRATSIAERFDVESVTLLQVAVSYAVVGKRKRWH